MNSCNVMNAQTRKKAVSSSTASRSLFESTFQERANSAQSVPEEGDRCRDRHRFSARGYNLAFNRTASVRRFHMPEDQRAGSNPLLSRRQIMGSYGKAVLAGIAAGNVSTAEEKRPRIACVVTYWAA